jgi:hypothetical protein
MKSISIGPNVIARALQVILLQFRIIIGTPLMFYNAYIGLGVKYTYASGGLGIYFLIKKHKAWQTKNQVE